MKSAFLRASRAHLEAAEVGAVPGTEKAPTVLARSSGDSIHEESAARGTPYRWMREIGEKAGIKELRLHDVRRTGASRLEDLQVESDVIEAALGHSRPSLTKTYRPGFPTEKVRTALTKLADHWREALGDAWWEPDEKKRKAIAAEFAGWDM